MSHCLDCDICWLHCPVLWVVAAEYGDYTRGSRIVTDDTKAAMKEVLTEIQSGAFAHEWLAQAKEGAPFLLEQREKGKTHQIEEIGKELRAMMPFLDPKTADN